MPTLKVFRELPVSQLIVKTGDITLEGALGVEDIFKQLKDPRSLVSRLLDDNLDKWRTSVRREFGVKLGHKNYKNRSEAKLHPAERLNARFRCIKCNKVGATFREDG